jgi:hypothetical protein
MKKIILLLLLVSGVMNGQSEAQLKFDKDLRVKFDSFKDTPITTEESRSLVINAVETISKYTMDPILKLETKEYLEKIKTQKLVQNKQSDLSKLPPDLLKKFNQYTDKFSLTTFLTHKKTDNLYIAVKNDIAYLKFKIIYRGSDWVFMKKIIFLIDGQNYEYIPIKVKRDVVIGSGVTETVEETVTDSYLPLMNAIANAISDIQVRFEGDKYKDQIYYQKRMSLPFKETLELYNLFK